MKYGMIFLSEKNRAGAVIFLFACGLLLFAKSAQAQNKISLETCEDLKIAKKLYQFLTVETASCVNPAKTFEPKGTLHNVYVLATFPAVKTGAKITFLINENNADGSQIQYVDYWASEHHTTAYAGLTINQPGKYFVRMVNTLNQSQIWASAEFTVTEDKIGARSSGNTAAGLGKVSICREIDDDWKCIEQANQWTANKSFNVLFENPTPVGVDFIGIVIFKRGADGKDAEFVAEYQQNIGMESRKYATVGDEIKLPAGSYSVYIIAWGKRELNEHRGNLAEYFAKTNLTVK